MRGHHARRRGDAQQRGAAGHGAPGARLAVRLSAQRQDADARHVPAAHCQGHCVWHALHPQPAPGRDPRRPQGEECACGRQLQGQDLRLWPFPRKFGREIPPPPVKPKYCE